MADCTHQRAGEPVVDQRPRPREANARDAATIVAVTPTPEARSQLSPSERAEPSDVIRCHPRQRLRTSMPRKFPMPRRT